jgi:hypothetical protein
MFGDERLTAENPFDATDVINAAKNSVASTSRVAVRSGL